MLPWLIKGKPKIKIKKSNNLEDMTVKKNFHHITSIIIKDQWSEVDGPGIQTAKREEDELFHSSFLKLAWCTIWSVENWILSS